MLLLLLLLCRLRLLLRRCDVRPLFLSRQHDVGTLLLPQTLYYCALGANSLYSITTKYLRDFTTSFDTLRQQVRDYCAPMRGRAM